MGGYNSDKKGNFDYRNADLGQDIIFIRFMFLKIVRINTWLHFFKNFSHLVRFSFHKTREHYQQTNWLDRDRKMVKVLSQHAITIILTSKKLFMRLMSKCLKWCRQSVEKGFNHIICLNRLNYLANTWLFYQIYV